MKFRRGFRPWMAGLVSIGGSLMGAQDLNQTCEWTRRELVSVEGVASVQSADRFQDEGKEYRGCLVRVLGNGGDPGTALHERLFPTEENHLFDLGWRADREADGPDGTSFRILRGRIFCIVEGRWDGGDDSDPDYVPSDEFELSAGCAVLEE